MVIMEGLYNSRYEHDSCGIGGVVSVKGKKEHKIIDDAIKIAERLEHRAGKDGSGKIGDGVGIITQIPHDFFKKHSGADVGKEGDYGVGMFFFSKDENLRSRAMKMLELIVLKEGAELIGWRNVPVDIEVLCEAERAAAPFIMQCFIRRPEAVNPGIDFDRKLYTIRRVFEQSNEDSYVASLSSRTIVYKGRLLVGQLRLFFKDLQSSDYKSAMALVHSRFSTNTNPSWERAHPNRVLLHNGEINTIRGNADRMLAREESMSSEFLNSQTEKILPVIDTKGSDSSMLDNAVEFLLMNGIDLPLAMMITMPEPWEKNKSMNREKKDMYKYYSTMMEPWDGPAAVLFTDGEVVGAVLDRNGLRPVRYCVTNDGYLVLSSEAGVLDIKPGNVIKKSRLSPGKMLVADLKKGILYGDRELKEYYSSQHPYGEWLDRFLVRLNALPIPNKKIKSYSDEERDRLYKAFGYKPQEFTQVICPMAQNGTEATSAMGADLPLAVLSREPQPLFDYFKQIFAQVTNPPIDAIREASVTDASIYAGGNGNLLYASGENCQVLQIDNPILSATDLLKIQSLRYGSMKAETVSLLYYKNTSLEKAVEQLFIKCDKAYKSGAGIIILSDRGVDENHLAIPSLLAVSALEQYLVRTKKRTELSVVLESGEPRDVHHFALLLGYGAAAVNPYLAHEAIGELIEKDMLHKDLHTAISDYNKAILDGVIRVASKMGISTLRSYQSAQAFEALGINCETVDKYFTNTVTRIEGIGIKEIGEAVEYNHNIAWSEAEPLFGRKGIDKSLYMFNPETVTSLQAAVRKGDYGLYKKYAGLVNDETNPHTLRGLLEFAGKTPVPLEEVESADSIVKRFKTGAVSFGSISPEAHECMAEAMNSIGGKSNSGEGGEEAERLFSPLSSKIKQVASGRFGVTSAYLVSAEEIQIKIAQGAKPGEGGHLPGKKVYPRIAKIRSSTPGISLISPPPHHDIYSIEDLAQLIYDLKNANRNADISVKLVSEPGVGTIASGVAKAGAQVILVSGFDGGTGAAPKSSVSNAGLPWELGLAEAHQTLIKNGLRSRVRLEADGKLMTGRDVAIACLLGAEEFSFATAPMVAMGCVMLRICNKDTCPVGIATQNPELRKRFKGKPEHIINYMKFVACELREIMAKIGVRTVDEMVGRTDLLKRRTSNYAPNAGLVNLDLLLMPQKNKKIRFDKNDIYNFNLEETADVKLLRKLIDSFEKTGKPVEKEITVSATDRTVGTILGSEITKKYGNSLPHNSITVKCKGSGGQSFGAFMPKGLTLRLQGEANDGLGKGLSGGRLVVYPNPVPGFEPDKNIIVGNVALYGATGGEAFISGRAGERFCVRNSGAVAVCEGVGDHGLEYMTGGTAVILGETGNNLAAGMSGGVAYVYDPLHNLYTRLNKELVYLEDITDGDDVSLLRSLLTRHVEETASPLAAKLLENFSGEIANFKKIIPAVYKKITKQLKMCSQKGMNPEEAEDYVFDKINNGF
ncbi:MAG: glutamate synthase large subunit [Clostridia bacterium]|nr:glutamate synthase large subunit [Clostridia bacterium]